MQSVKRKITNSCTENWKCLKQNSLGEVTGGSDWGKWFHIGVDENKTVVKGNDQVGTFTEKISRAVGFMGLILYCLQDLQNLLPLTIPAWWTDPALTFLKKT